jgi:type I restriction enzyme R subunit
MISSTNFEFLRQHNAQLCRLGALAERYFQDDPNTCLLKLRQFAELLAQLTAVNVGLFDPVEESQANLLARLKWKGILPPQVSDLFYQIRITGNRAAHSGEILGDDYSLALTQLKFARQLGIWFHRTFNQDHNFRPGAFTPPSPPKDATKELILELEQLRNLLKETQSQAEQAQWLAEQQTQALLSAEQKALQEAEERALWEQLAQESEEERAKLKYELSELQKLSAISSQQTAKIINFADRAAAKIDLNEKETREIIDQQLRDRGWEVDSQNLQYSQGARPIKGKNRAIAEWPTANGRADYALFVGTRCVAMVEAKRRRKNVSTAIDQAERYAKGFQLKEGIQSLGTWGDFQVPFVLATNGRPYLKQIETESGIWFRDVRKPTNLRRALSSWPSPQGLEDQLEMDHETAHLKLQKESFNFEFELRPYQRQAIEAVEQALSLGRREMLVAMATGTGKTKLAIALLYRLLNAKRFKRICFVVDRSALGIQTADEFRTTKMATAKTFANIFGLQGLKEIVPESETKVHICTIQGLVKRVLFAKEPGDIPPIDQYDLLVVDECHRGYLLDREMSEAELEFRGQEDYISKYRHVLEYFDAVKIALTATPALHTVQIFGKEIFKYSYRTAVIDGYLIDHEPAIQLTTALSQTGIKFKAGETIELFNTKTGVVEQTVLPDDLDFDVDEFNKKVITVPFNKAVAQELASQIDINLPGKTLIFAVNDGHADIVVEEFKKAFKERYGEIEDESIQKLTGSVDQVQKKIRAYRNDPFPKIAVTVDLLTTGIDVPKIVNLVFLRKVNSRILYDQMIGRATRKCDEIDKEIFRIFDAVDLYKNLQNLTELKPVVINPKITLKQLFDEFQQVTKESHRQEICEQIQAKLNRRLSRLTEEARQRYEGESGESPEATLERFRTENLTELRVWVQERPQIGPILDWNPESDGQWLPISNQDDQVIQVTVGYSGGQRPDDFLDSFSAYIRDNLNRIAALTVLVQRPRELTRSQLRELRLELDKMGFSDASLRKAWQDTKNEDIAASIIGFIRQAALGDPLIPYEERVKQAMRRILARQDWTTPQRQWLQRIGEQIIREMIVDRDALNQEPFQKDGGFNRLNRIFDGQLETILGDINEELWQRKA